MRNILLRLGGCIIPLVLTPVWGFLIAEGHLNFGGGEKDLLMLIPWLVWSLIFLIIYIVAWQRSLLILRSFLYASAGATVALGILWGVMFLWFSGLLGIS